MDNAIVGVRYIGKKESQEDTVCNTGAVWLPGQVHNFAAGLAKQLFIHTDSFEPAEIDMDGDTFMSAGKQKPRDTASYINLTAMSIDQMVHLARFEFNRVVNPEGKDVDRVRREVHSLMLNHSLDLAEADRNAAKQEADYVVPLIYQATPEEMAAIKAGDLVLTLAPAGKPSETGEGETVEDDNLLGYVATPAEMQAILEGRAELRVVAIYNGPLTGEQTNAPAAGGEQGSGEGDGATDGAGASNGNSGEPDPFEQVAAMTKAQLIAFASEKFGAKLNVRSSVDELRLQVADLIQGKAPAAGGEQEGLQ